MDRLLVFVWKFYRMFCCADATVVIVKHRQKLGNRLKELNAVCRIFVCYFIGILQILRLDLRTIVLSDGMTQNLRLLVSWRLVVQSNDMLKGAYEKVSRGNNINARRLSWKTFLTRCVYDVLRFFCVRHYHALWLENLSTGEANDQNLVWLCGGSFYYTASCKRSMTTYRLFWWPNREKSMKIRIG